MHHIPVPHPAAESIAAFGEWEARVYQWWVFVHLAGVFAFLVSHGASVIITFRLRQERDPHRVAALLQLSSSTISAFYASLVVLLVGGIVAASLGNLWGYGWIWGAVVILLVVSLAMYFVARPYYRRVRFVTAAIVDGSEAVSPQQYDSILRSGRPLTIAGIGMAGLALILYLMLFKPTLGLSPGQSLASAPIARATVASGPRGPVISLAATELAFTTDHLSIAGGKKFTLVFDNRAAGVSHNVAIYDSTDRALFTGEIVPGPQRVTYRVPALPPGTYRFVCDVHPQQMTGTLVAK
ncbi:MAG: cupredoxin domain-containing protein [Actinomycetota bacterium]|nr:cupredoxin domain-containing protein [Actinomycetota bacterium]